MARFFTSVTLSGLVLLGGACATVRYDPTRATRLYPAALHQGNTVDIHVFRDGESLEIINTTSRSFENAALWINQRYVHDGVNLPPGAKVKLSLDSFRDVRGEGLHPGGLLRQFDPTPVRLVEIQTGEEPLLGLITIRDEPAE